MQIRGTEIPIYKGNEPFVFVSYSRQNINMVEGVLRVMNANGFRMWYDQMGEGIDAGMKWREVIDERLDSSRAFLIFLSYGAQDRAEVMRELEMACRKKQEDPSYVILTVFLNRIPFRDFPESARTVLGEGQNICMWLYGGVTERFVRRIVYAPVWPTDIVDNRTRQENGLSVWQADSITDSDMDFHLSDMEEYVYPGAVPEQTEVESEGQRIRFYQVSLEEVSPHAVYPFVMDNQWCPEYFYQDRRFLKKGFFDRELMEERERLQKMGIYRGLLHARQLLVNRAFLQNSTVFIHWYKAVETPEYESFCHMLENGSILLVLFKERMPCEKAAYGNTDWEAWKKLCAEHVTYCLRMDWEDDQTNQMETDKRMGYLFHNYCITTAENKYRLEEICSAFGLSESQAENMLKKWKTIQSKAMQMRRQTGQVYTRNQFYIDHVIEKDTPVVECRISRRKRFARELKQIIDMRYNLNFTKAYGIKPMIPADVTVNPVAADDMSDMMEGREILAEELIYAVGSFCPDLFLKEMPVMADQELTLDQVEAVRNLPQWQRYIRCVEEADDRARQWDIDFSYIEAVWEEYHNWILAVCEKFPEMARKQMPGAVTVIFRIGSNEIRAVYRQNASGPEILEYGMLPLGRKQTFSVDYICADLSQTGQENCFFTEIQLFKGWTHEKGSYMYEKLKERLNAEVR